MYLHVFDTNVNEGSMFDLTSALKWILTFDVRTDGRNLGLFSFLSIKEILDIYSGLFTSVVD